MKGMDRLRVSRDAKQSVWRSLSARNLMISQRSSSGNSGERFDDAIVVTVDGVVKGKAHTVAVYRSLASY